MCGICGIIRFDSKPVLETPIRQMMQIMKHRGPDDEGVFIENNIGLGFVRLSIIDLSSAGHQPMVSKDERYVVVFNGEIFNYIELREDLKKEGIVFNTESDTEVLINSYIRWGEDCLDHFNGMWAFVIYDRLKKSIFASRDRFGIKPYYYLHTTEFFAFASEIPPLLSLLPSKPKPDYQSIFDFLAFSRTDQTERTFFNEIKKLQHGRKFRMDLSFTPLGSIKGGEEWYNLKENVSKAQGFSSPEEFRESLCSAVGFRLRSDVPVGVCFSGGLDSSSLVSILIENYKMKELNTFSAVYNKGQTGDETEFINEYSTSLKNMYYTTPTAETLIFDLKSFIKAHAEPIPGTSPYAQFKIMELARGKVVVTLDGQGADELLAGYHYFFGFYFKDLLVSLQLRKFFREIFHYITKHKSLFGIKSLLFFLLPEQVRTNIRVKEKAYLNIKFVKQFGKSNNIAGNLYGAKTLNDALLSHFEFKLEHLLKWEDRNSMWFSIEARVPFLDHRLVEKVLADSNDMVIYKGMTKYLLRESMKGIIPEKIRLRRDKIGFDTPQDEWFRKPEWQKIIEEVLFSQSFKDRNIVNPAITRDKYKKHLEGKIDCSAEIWKWIHLELWFRDFIDK